MLQSTKTLCIIRSVIYILTLMRNAAHSGWQWLDSAPPRSNDTNDMQGSSPTDNQERIHQSSLAIDKKCTCASQNNGCLAVPRKKLAHKR